MVERSSQDSLGQLTLDLVEDVLRRWLRVNEQGTAMYEALPAEQRAFIEEHGGTFESFVPTMAMMRPDERMLAHTWLVDALAALQGMRDRGSLSQAVGRVLDVAEDSEHPGTDEERLAAIERRATAMEEGLVSLATAVGTLDQTLTRVEQLLRDLRGREERERRESDRRSAGSQAPG